MRENTKTRACQVMTLLAVLAATLAAAPARAWTIADDFEGSGVGLWTSQLVTTYAHAGSHAIGIVLAQGVENDGQWTYPLGSDLYEGDDLWVRVYLYPPGGFDWTCSPITKLVRVAVADASGAGASYASILATRPQNYGCGDGGAYGYVVSGQEMNSGQTPPPICQNRNNGDGGAYLTPGRWHSLELYLHVSATAGIMRVWHDGVLRNEYAYPTIPAGGYIPRIDTTDWTAHHLLGWWNGGPTQTQTIYFDDFVVTNETPANRDAAGNPMIGPTDWSVVRPKAPANLRVQ